MCDLETIGVSSILRLIRSAAALTQAVGCSAGRVQQ